VKRLPFFSVTGPSGSGKTTVCARLWKTLPECVTLDGDSLWRSEFWADRGEWFYGAWLRVAANVQQNGRPVVLCTAAMPAVWDVLPERALFNDVHALALVCDEDVLRTRLEARRPFGARTPETFLEDTLNFNRWLREHVESVDTSSADPEQTSAQVAEWVRARL